MKIVKQFAIVFFILYLGYVIVSLLHLPIPANVVGMVLLLLALIAKIIKREDAEDVSAFIIQYLPVFFIAPSAGIMLYFDLFKKEFLAIFIPLLISIILGFLVAGKVTELLMKKGDE
ncbi:MAG: CidA/LrgA family protein [Clostridiales bacterium]|nr:CidA/LrgA family protein [Clostridiales bacterium]